MKPKVVALSAVGTLVLAGIIYALLGQRGPLVLTGIVTTDEVIVSAEIEGRIERLLVNQGDSVKSNQLVALLQPREWQADVAYYTDTEKQTAAQVAQARAELEFQEAQTSNQVAQAEANRAAADAAVLQAKADLENARLNFERLQGLYRQHVEAVQAYDQARTAYEAAKARVETFQKQAQAADVGVALARASSSQVAVRRAALAGALQRTAAAAAQKRKAGVRLGYTEIHAPVDGVVDLRPALQGEIVNPGQAIVTLVNPDNLWVRADVEETYIDRIHLGQTMTVRLPSGQRRVGTVFFRGVDADYATQRDVSRTKRDIKTFEVRLRCDNRDRSLAVGMTAYVTLPRS